MKLSRSNKFSIAAATSIMVLSTCIAGSVSANASESTPRGVVIAQDSAQSSTQNSAQKFAFTAHPTKPGVVTVTTQPQSNVRLTAKKSKSAKALSITKKSNKLGVVNFSNLTPGVIYSVASVNGKSTVQALNTVKPARNLMVMSTSLSDSVELSWDHATSPSTGGKLIEYILTATDESGEQVTQRSSKTVAIMSGLNPDQIYTFSVTPVNAMGEGIATSATMNATLRSLMSEAPKAISVQEPRNSIARPAATQTTPATRTVSTCPAGYTDTGANCRKSQAYTFSYMPYTYHEDITNLPYTFHTVATGPAPILDSFETQNICPNGYNLEDYGVNGKWCRLYGPAPTAQEKDAAPAGFTDNGSYYTKSEQVLDSAPAGYTDNGTEWEKKNPAPAGFTDNGNEYVSTTGKVNTVVPA